MEHKSVDIDLIWSSLKNVDLTGKSDVTFTRNLVQEQKRRKPKNHRNLKKIKDDASRKKNTTCVTALQDHPTSVCCPLTLHSESSLQQMDLQCAEEGNCHFIFPLLNNNEVTSTANMVTFDSDDEKDQHDLCVQEDNLPYQGRPWTLNLYVSSMQSQNLSCKVRALTSLKMTMENLCKEIPEPPIIDFPPPYDTSRIALTYRQGSIISDLPQGSFVPDWAAWSRTNGSAMDQFAPRVSEVKDESSPQCSSTTQLRTASENLQALVNSCGIPLFRLFNDRSEKCRQLALQCTIIACLHTVDMGKHLPFLMSALQSRYPESSLDSSMKFFIDDADSHDRYMRGSAEVRQDKLMLLSSVKTFKVIENSEECRLLLCKVFSSIVRGRVFHGNISVLCPYFSDFIFTLQSSLHDPFPEVKIESCNILVQLLRIPQLESVAKAFSTPLALAALGNMRNRNAKVRIAAIELFQASVCVPDREKLKGAGSEAILELVGFREENVLPVAAFYDAACGVSINALAELVQDKNSFVRSKCCSMISFFMTCLPDRSDFHQRLLPYLLSLFKDSTESTRQIAMQTIEICGQQHEAENSDDVIERRQFGVDGDSRCNHISPLPFPFVARPRLGARLFVRENTKRFFDALLRELTNWRSATKMRAAHLLEILLVYCEEHLTMDISRTLSLLVQGLRLAMDDLDHRCGQEMKESILNCIELVGRYIDPATYISIILPRVVGNSDSTTFCEGGVHSNASRAANATCLAALIKGSLLGQLIPHLCGLITTLCSLFCVKRNLESSSLTNEYINCLVVILEKFTEEGTQMVPLRVFFQKSEKASQLHSFLQSCSDCLASHCESAVVPFESEFRSRIQKGQESIKQILVAIEL